MTREIIRRPQHRRPQNRLELLRETPEFDQLGFEEVLLTQWIARIVMFLIGWRWLIRGRLD